MKIEIKIQNEDSKSKKNNTRDSNVVPHHSTNVTRQCLTSLNGRMGLLSSIRWSGGVDFIR
jgi:hypothetical protein